MSKYSVRLNQEQRKSLEQIVKSGKAPARKIMHAQILLSVDQGAHGPRRTMEQVKAALGVGVTVIFTTKKRFVENGLEDAISRRQQPDRPNKRKIDGEQEAQIIALMCTEQPEGQERWTLRALKQRVVELEIVEEVSHETLRTVLKKTN